MEGRTFLWASRICLTLEWLALGLWVGGLLVLVAAVIPAVFNTFGGQDSGGFFLTRAFEGFKNRILRVEGFHNMLGEKGDANAEAELELPR